MASWLKRPAYQNEPACRLALLHMAVGMEDELAAMRTALEEARRRLEAAEERVQVRLP